MLFEKTPNFSVTIEKSGQPLPGDISVECRPEGNWGNPISMISIGTHGIYKFLHENYGRTYCSVMEIFVNGDFIGTFGDEAIISL